LLVVLAVLGCIRPPAAEVPGAPTRLPILEPDYGASAEHPAAIRPGDRVAMLELPLADGGTLALADALAAGPVVLIWIGGAEHESLIDWIHELDGSLAQLEQRSATLAFVRPIEPGAALGWATELRLQTPVVSDPEGQLGRMLDIDAAPLEFAVLLVADGQLVYRKLGGRRPQLAELLAVLDGEAERLRCCPTACAEPACE
jgi:peroxiredoxin